MYPKLYGRNGWTMVWQPDANVTTTLNGPTLCWMNFGHIAKAIESVARAFADEPRQPQLGDPVR